MTADLTLYSTLHIVYSAVKKLHAVNKIGAKQRAKNDIKITANLADFDCNQ